MRRKITEAEDPGDDLPELTERQRNFVECILAGKTASDAYRASYDCSNSADRTIWTEASKLRNNPDVAQWLSAARKAGLGNAKVTLEGHVAELERLREIAIDSGNVGAAVQAEQLRGKASGHYTENVRLEHVNPDNVLEEIRKLNPDLADQLSAQHLGGYNGETLQ